MPSKKSAAKKPPAKKRAPKKAAAPKPPAKKKPAAKKKPTPATPFIFVRIDDDNQRVLLDGHRIGGVYDDGGPWFYRLPSSWNELVGPFPSREEAAAALHKATA